MFLNPEELALLTGYKQSTWQKKWLDRSGIRYLTNKAGRPMLAKAEIERLLSGAGEATKREPKVNFSEPETSRASSKNEVSSW